MKRQLNLIVVGFLAISLPLVAAAKQPKENAGIGHQVNGGDDEDDDNNNDASAASEDVEFPWITVDDYYPGGAGSYAGANSMAAGKYGKLFVCGGYTDQSAGTFTVTPLPGGGTYVTADERGGSYWRVTRSSDRGTAWETVDEFGGPAGVAAASCYSIVETKKHTILAAGFYGPNSDLFVRKSIDDGATWTTAYQGPTDMWHLKLYTDPRGFVLAAGFSNPVPSGFRWSVTKGSGDGSSWSVVDNFQYAPGRTSWANGAARDSEGNWYVVGQGQDNATPVRKTHWLVRKSTDQGATWTTIDDFVRDRSNTAQAIAIDADDNIYVGGQTSGCCGSITQWLVRKSSDGGATWTTAEDMTIPNGGGPRNMFASGDNVYVLGSNTRWSWEVRTSPDNGATWESVSIFRYADAGAALGEFMVLDKGNLHVAGRALPVSGVTPNWIDRAHWIVRRQLHVE